MTNNLQESFCTFPHPADAELYIGILVLSISDKESSLLVILEFTIGIV